MVGGLEWDKEGAGWTDFKSIFQVEQRRLGGWGGAGGEG